MKTPSDSESKDEIIQEIRRIKHDLGEFMAFDIDRILEDARRKQKSGGKRVVSPPVRQGR